MNTKQLTFIIMMGALGNALFIISSLVGQVAPGIALDFSLIAVLIAGVFGGPVAGLVTGLIAGIGPGIMFGPAGNGGILGLIGLPIGKALTGVLAGLIVTRLKLNEGHHSSWLGVPLTLTSYVPEGLFTYAYFSVLLPLFTMKPALNIAIISTIMIKAVIEVTIISFLIAALLGNKGFNDFIRAYFCKPQITKPLIEAQETRQPAPK
jgi:riboflavin transporter FmnP